MHHCDTSNLWSACADDVDSIECYRVQIVDVSEEVHGVDAICACQHSPDERRLDFKALSCAEGFLASSSGLCVSQCRAVCCRRLQAGHLRNS